MLIVAALGGNALLRRGEPVAPATQAQNVKAAAAALADLAPGHSLVVTHGNGPQVGLLALHDDPAQPFPLDVLDAQTQGMIGYLLAQELGNVLPDRDVVTLLTRTVVGARDPAFRRPAKPIGPVYPQFEAERVAAEHGWTIAPDGAYFRRVVASPRPRDIVELRTIRRLLADGTIVVCAGGGGIPVVAEDGKLRGVEAVVDKDLVAALLAERLRADVLLLLTDVEHVVQDWGTADAMPVHDTDPASLRALRFESGSMGPKVDAACAFVERTGRRAAIGSLTDAAAVLRGEVGTQVAARASGTVNPDAHAAVPGARARHVA